MKFLLPFVALVLLADGCQRAPISVSSAPGKWEYKFLSLTNYNTMHAYDIAVLGKPDEVRYNRSGAGFFDPPTDYPPEIIREAGVEGWELVTSTPILETVHCETGPNTRTAQIQLIFKRPLK